MLLHKYHTAYLKASLNVENWKDLAVIHLRKINLNSKHLYYDGRLICCMFMEYRLG